MIVCQEFEGEIARVNRRQKQVSSCRQRSWRFDIDHSNGAPAAQESCFGQSLAVGRRSQQCCCVVRFPPSNQRAVDARCCSSGRRRHPYTGPGEMTTQALESSGKEAASKSMIQAARLQSVRHCPGKIFSRRKLLAGTPPALRREAQQQPRAGQNRVEPHTVGRALPAARDERRWVDGRLTVAFRGGGARPPDSTAGPRRWLHVNVAS
jgi:hypothetical protein